MEHFSVQTPAEAKGIQLRLECPDWESEWLVDGVLVQASLTRLLRNAIQHSPEGSKVEVRAMLDEDSVTLELRDYGQGVPEHLLPQLFNLFVSGPNGGIGTGLYYARCVAQAHGGSLTYEAQSPGALFRLQLPKNVESRN